MLATVQSGVDLRADPLFHDQELEKHILTYPLVSNASFPVAYEGHKNFYGEPHLILNVSC